jgi:hypothetical protein
MPHPGRSQAGYVGLRRRATAVAVLHRLSCAAPADKSAVCQPSGHPSMPVRRSQATQGPWARAACGVCGSHTTCSTRIARPQAAPCLVFIGPKILKPSRRAVYLYAADNCVRALQRRLPGVKQTIIAPQIRVSVPCSTRFVSLRTHQPHVVAQFSSSLMAYSGWDWGHGGTRNRSISRSVHPWSVNPAAIAGVCGCHILAEPVPWVGIGCGKGRRKLACGKQKL